MGMRTVVIASLLALATATPAFADENVTGNYDVKFEEAGSTCERNPVTLTKGKLVIDIKKSTLTVNIETIYQMVGVPQKNGKISAKTTKIVGTTVGGLSARYSIAGRVEGGMLQLVLTAEYVRQDTNKPYCTQAWNVNGLRNDAEKKTKP
jgi:hypothetical protein